MACIGGILLCVAFNMVKPAEVKQVLAHSRFHVGLMVYTAVMVIVTDFLTGVLTGMVLYAADCSSSFDKPRDRHVGERRHGRIGRRQGPTAS